MTVMKQKLCIAAAAILMSGCGQSPAPAPAPLPPTVSGPAPVSAAPAPTEPKPTVITMNSASALPKGSDVAPVYSPEEERARFRLPEGYRMELVAAEPLVQDPIAIDFDADGRMYVVEMRAYMPNLDGTGEDAPVGRIVVVEDTNDDGRMDRATVFLDSLVLPRAVKVTEHGVLVGAPPNLWLVRDTNGDLRADTRELVRSDYGDPRGNPEHNANGLYWGMDNWIHNANYPGQLRMGADGKIVFRKTADEGQWGLSADEYGRLYRNSNEDPLRADLVPSHYATRSANLGNVRGIYDQLTPNIAVFPDHKTPAINRGYRPQTMRADSTLAHYTSAGGPTAYIGDRLPVELRKSVFITESAANMVGRIDVTEGRDGTLSAKTAYDRKEFLTATDERFRPVNLANAPDGTLYVVDMYRGIIQHRAYITGYLEQKIIERGLTQPIGLGRIWRVVHASSARGEKPALSRKSSADLVPVLAHANGWWRNTAQRLLVERGDRSVSGALREMARMHRDDRARLHALWTLDGLGAADSATIVRALADSSAPIRAAAIRIAEPSLARSSGALNAAVMNLTSDRAPVVRRQLAATLGELPLGAREDALLQVVDHHGDDPVVADLVVSALEGRELAFLERVLAVKGTAGRHALVTRTLSRAIVASRKAADVERIVAMSGEPARPRWQRFAMLEGFGGGQGQLGGDGLGGGGRGGGGVGIRLSTKPQALIAATTSADTALRARATRVAAAVTWPGKTATGPVVAALTPAEQARFAAGRQQYTASCAGCHQAAGTGLTGVAKSLVGSRWVLGNPEALIRILLHGKEGEMLMPAVGSTLTPDQIAAVLTYVRRSWGNGATAVTPTQASEVAGANLGRKKPWTEAELARIRR